MLIVFLPVGVERGAMKTFASLLLWTHDWWGGTCKFNLPRPPRRPLCVTTIERQTMLLGDCALHSANSTGVDMVYLRVECYVFTIVEPLVCVVGLALNLLCLMVRYLT